MSDPQDELSPRELYLILKRGLPLIIGAAIIIGLAVFLVMSLQPRTYLAEATVLVTPIPVRFQGEARLGFDPKNNVSFQTYQTVAFSRSVLEGTLTELQDPDLQVGDLSDIFTLTRIDGPQRSDQPAPLTVSHKATYHDARRAAELADAWAKQTIEAVRSSQLADLSSIKTITDEEAARLRNELSDVEAAWKSFQERDNSSILEAQLSSLTSRITSGEEELDRLARDIATSTARQELLVAQLSRTGGAETSVDPGSQLELLRAQGVISENLMAQITTLLARQPIAGRGFESDLLELIARSALQQEAVLSAGLLAERDQLELQLQTYRRQANDLRQESAALEEERTQLVRDLAGARSAYQDISSLQPVISYLLQLTPGISRILSQAAVPANPVGPRPLLATLLGTVLAGILATLLVFLREAVSPPPTAAGAPRQERFNRAGGG